MNKIKLNYLVDMIALISFFVTAVTGIIIFIFLPPSGGSGIHSELFGYGRHDWGAVHDWAGIIMTVAAFIHIVLHWKWIIATTKNIFIKK